MPTGKPPIAPRSTTSNRHHKPRYALVAGFLARPMLVVPALHPSVLAKQYFDLFSAPQNVYVPIAGRGHGVLFDDPDAFIAAMDKHVRPLVPREQ
jgi:pimeloyl-ACP methyl ester carboxylesterase